MSDEPDVIRLQMNQTRTDLSEKLSALESQVGHTITSVRDAADNVSATLDLRQHVQRHPWLAVCGAAVVGYLAEKLIYPPDNPPVIQNDQPSIPQPEAMSPPRSHLVSSLESVVQNVAQQGAPLLLDYLVRLWCSPPTPQPSEPVDRPTVPMSDHNALYNTSPVKRDVV